MKDGDHILPPFADLDHLRTNSSTKSAYTKRKRVYEHMCNYPGGPECFIIHHEDYTCNKVYEEFVKKSRTA